MKNPFSDIPLAEASGFFLSLRQFPKVANMAPPQILPATAMGQNKVPMTAPSLTPTARGENAIKVARIKRAAEEMATLPSPGAQGAAPLDPSAYLAVEQAGQNAQNENAVEFYKQKLEEAKAELAQLQEGQQSAQQQIQQLSEQMQQSQQAAEGERQNFQSMTAQATQQAAMAQDQALMAQRASAAMRMAYQQLRGSLLELAQNDPPAGTGGDPSTAAPPPGMVPPGDPAQMGQGAPAPAGAPAEAAAPPTPGGEVKQAEPDLAGMGIGALSGMYAATRKGAKGDGHDAGHVLRRGLLGAVSGSLSPKQQMGGEGRVLRNLKYLENGGSLAGSAAGLGLSAAAHHGFKRLESASAANLANRVLKVKTARYTAEDEQRDAEAEHDKEMSKIDAKNRAVPHILLPPALVSAINVGALGSAIGSIAGPRYALGGLGAGMALGAVSSKSKSKLTPVTFPHAGMLGGTLLGSLRSGPLSSTVAGGLGYGLGSLAEHALKRSETSPQEKEAGLRDVAGALAGQARQIGGVLKDRAPMVAAGTLLGGGASLASQQLGSRSDDLRQKLTQQQQNGDGGFANALRTAATKARLAVSEVEDAHPFASAGMGALLGAGTGFSAGPQMRASVDNIKNNLGQIRHLGKK